MTYLGFGCLLIALAWQGPDGLALSPLGHAREITAAMGITGAALIASDIVDIYIISDFIRTDGQNVGRTLSVIQTVFVLLIGLCAAFGRVSGAARLEEETAPARAQTSVAEDSEIIARLDALFKNERLHLSEDLSLSRLRRRLSLPDRRVSQAINRTQSLSVSQFVNEYRIKQSCALLQTTSDTILAVSLASGFATKSNFNR